MDGKGYTLQYTTKYDTWQKHCSEVSFPDDQIFHQKPAPRDTFYTYSGALSEPMLFTLQEKRSQREKIELGHLAFFMSDVINI